VKTQLVITDVTRMQEGRVCVAGYDRSFNCIRPVLPPPGIQEATLYSEGCAVVFPFAVVEYDLLQHTPKPPHIEDHRYDPSSVRFVYKVDEGRKRAILDRTRFESVNDIFEVPLCCDPGHYVTDGGGVRSLGTIRPRQVRGVWYEQSPEGKWKYRLNFVDGKGVEFRLTVTDLAWRYYCDWQRDQGTSPQAVARDLGTTLRSRVVYLRIGLARGWEKFPDRCYLQITGVYSFPDYLNGRTFADLAPRANQPRPEAS
jgi:hypothetical protein